MPQLPPIPSVPGLTTTPPVPVEEPLPKTEPQVYLTTKPQTTEEFWGTPTGDPGPGYSSVPVSKFDIHAMANLVKGIHSGEYAYFGPKAKGVVDEIYSRTEGTDYAVARELLVGMNSGTTPSFDVPLHETDPYVQKHKQRMEEVQRKRGPERYIDESKIGKEWVFLSPEDQAKYIEQVVKGNVHPGEWLEKDIHTYYERADNDAMQAALDFTVDLYNHKISGIDAATYRVSAPFIIEQRAAMQEGENIPGVIPGKQPAPRAKPKAAPVPKKAAPAQKTRTPEQEAIHQDIIGQEQWGGPGGVQLKELTPKTRKKIEGAPK